MSEIVQGSEEWRQLRCGKVTASRVADVVARTKTGYGASRANYMAELIVERLTGQPVEGYQNAAMQWGQAMEAEARDAYELRTDYDVHEIAFVAHPSIEDAGASPDGLVGDDGLVELKCPQTATHIETLLAGTVPDKYVKQVQWQMACTGRKWCDWVSYDPRLPEPMRLFVKRINRDDALIASLEAEVREFLIELTLKVGLLRARYAPTPKPAELLMAG